MQIDLRSWSETYWGQYEDLEQTSTADLRVSFLLKPLTNFTCGLISDFK